MNIVYLHSPPGLENISKAKSLNLMYNDQIYNP